MEVTERVRAVGVGRVWVATALAAVLALVAGSLAAPRTVYWGFVWRYFWGPVYADAHNAICAIYRDGTLETVFSRTQCRLAADQGAIVAEPGYTLVSEVGYMIVLLFALIGVLQLARWLDVGLDRDLFYALVPYMLFGGALRVVEDANDALVVAGADQAIAYPWNTLIISPLIYVTVFGVTLATLVGALRLKRSGTIERYAPAMALAGTGFLVLTLSYLTWLALSTTAVSLHPQVLLTVVALATLIAGGLYVAVDRVAPVVNAGTGYIGLVVLWGHAIDGVANVIAADWLGVLGVDLEYSPKHPANEIIIGVTEAVLPQSLLATLGSSWPFLVVKMVIALAVVWIFDPEIMEESQRYALVLLTAIVAVGLGPGTRDVIRATFGI